MKKNGSSLVITNYIQIFSILWEKWRSIHSICTIVSNAKYFENITNFFHISAKHFHIQSLCWVFNIPKENATMLLLIELANSWRKKGAELDQWTFVYSYGIFEFFLLWRRNGIYYWACIIWTRDKHYLCAKNGKYS